MNSKTFLALAVAAVLLPATAASAELELSWGDLDKFADVESGENNRARYRERMVEGFEAIFQRQAEQLPEDQTLKIHITNLDLAGMVDMSGPDRVRVVRRGHPPVIHFDYELLSASGESLMAGEERLVGRDVSDSISRGHRNRDRMLAYERDAIEKWFNETFTERN